MTAKTRARSHADGLTLDQQSAVDLLAGGKTDTETAAALNLNRVTVTRWRLYSLEFRAALAVRRADVWGAAADRLRALIPKAIDALADALADTTNADQRVTVALAVLKLAGPPAIPPDTPTDPNEIVREIVEREREMMRDRNDDSLDAVLGKPPYGEHVNAVRKRLALLSAVPKDEPQPVLESEGEPR
ncbi:hypothetical protein [Frigoriglobus tundricola]|uniref:Uncharacterized protein n=1 Tax=Frigoriglobus tundricola TaxID=2774151 RepID=A0A6M5Z3B8_9BACT|nr:hypothetical protein [Frigoriglobus tundricola]QJX00247.1 hypothetical protein FTUN_7871 [Frigoriglobus tundricola]